MTAEAETGGPSASWGGIQVTPEMVREGLLAFWGEILSWDNACDRERRDAMREVFIAMLRASPQFSPAGQR